MSDFRVWVAGLTECAALVADHVSTGLEVLASRLDVPDHPDEVDICTTHGTARTDLCPKCSHVHPIADIYGYLDDPTEAVLIGSWPCPQEDA